MQQPSGAGPAVPFPTTAAAGSDDDSENAHPVEVLLLNQVAVVTPDGVVPAGPPRRGTVLAVLALAAGSVVPQHTLVDALWDAELPGNAAANLQTYVWGLRKILGAVHLERVGDGYRLDLPRAACDALRAEDALGDARAVLRNGRREQRLATAGSLHALLEHWNGRALPGIPGSWGDQTRERLDRLRTELVGVWAELLLSAGQPEQVVRPLRQATAAAPLDEDLGVLLVRALRDLGRHQDALEEYERIRSALETELSVPPGPALRSLHRELRAAGHRPSRSTSSPAQLPPLPDGFVGRSAEVAELVARLDPDRGPGPAIVVLDGPGGIGKSALGLRVAHAVAADYPDGQLFAGLRAHHPGHELQPADVLQGFVQALGVRPEQVPAGEEQLSALLRSLLAARRVLIVLDDVPSAQVARQILPGSPHCAVLITSRARLQGLVLAEGAHRHAVRPLPAGESLELLRRHLGPAAVDADPRSALLLAELCEHWPLALRIVGELAIAHDVQSSLRAITAEIQAIGDDWMEGLRLDDDDTTAMSEVLSWSLTRLPDDECRRLYRLLGSCPTVTVDVNIVAALLDVSRARAGQLILTLASRHLLEPVAGRPGWYVVHDLIRMHARVQSRAIESPQVRDAAVLRVLEWYAACVAAARACLQLPASPLTGVLAAPGDAGERLGLTSRETATEWFAASRDNLLATVRTAGELTHPSAWQITIGMAGYLMEHHDPRAHALTHETAIEVSRSLGRPGVSTPLLNNLSFLHERLGNADTAIEMARQSVEAAFENAEPGLIAHTCGRLAWLALNAGLLGEAAQAAQRGLAVADPEDWRTYGLHLPLVGVLFRQGRPDEGWQHAQRTLELARRSELGWPVFHATSEVARNLLDHRPHDSLEMLAPVLSGSVDLPPLHVATARVTQAMAALRTGDHELAEFAARTAMTVFEETGTRRSDDASRAAEVLAELGAGAPVTGT
ncbi:hypothetical protein KIH74_28100 [Kineosporia sp. J2-2]|uniref:DNA-binding SARP family transcriptional activator n=1 Tax=Kineosporia corallincola TaxID=2835133 RepID=A0ABS5TP01_9ACTN|nr:BTAD domain-containing putative transcriptional regulator [Kineosporia corallincola]MBT0772837.1 hypothetical protein [Kineosporia corallincola]